MFGKLALSFLALSAPGPAFAACAVFLSNGAVAPPRFDPLARLLDAAPSCPKDVFELKSSIRGRGWNAFPSVVANRGRHNPALGSFSVFERVTGAGVPDGDFFFGHFTEAANGSVVLAQRPSSGTLMIELIAWDPRKGLYNFYEAIDDGRAAKWFYRGDSADILADNAFVHRDPPSGAPKFGARLRCSACHSTGGPIMKEITAPFNDWWTKSRPLPFGANAPEPRLGEILKRASDAAEFASSVRAGIAKLEGSPAYRARKAARSPQEELRALFCENEINLASDVAPFDAGAGTIAVPSPFVVHPLLGAPRISIPAGLYRSLLAKHGVRFPEIPRADADHAFLVPVRSAADDTALATLIRRRMIDEEFAADVLAVDSERPLFSAARCSLLKLVPNGPAWRDGLARNLERAGTPAAIEPLSNLRDPARTISFHRAEAARKIAALRPWTAAGAEKLFARMLEARAAVPASEISRNPRGRILEPGFRVIFPVPHKRR